MLHFLTFPCGCGTLHGVLYVVLFHFCSLLWLIGFISSLEVSMFWQLSCVNALHRQERALNSRKQCNTAYVLLTCGTLLLWKNAHEWRHSLAPNFFCSYVTLQFMICVYVQLLWFPSGASAVHLLERFNMITSRSLIHVCLSWFKGISFLTLPQSSFSHSNERVWRW